MAESLSKLAQELKPYILQWLPATRAGGAAAGGGISDHGQLSGLSDDDHLQYFNTPRGDARYLTLASYAAHVANPDAHHLRSHDLDSASDHTGTLSWSKINKAGSDLAHLATRKYTDLTNRTHSITGGDHSVVGAALDIIGLTAPSTLGVLTPSSDPGAAAAILRTSSNGSLFLDADTLYVDAANDRVGINRAPGGASLDVIAANNADHTLRVQQKSGQTGRLWRVENTGGQELIVLDSQGNLQSGNPGFVSGLTGWQITPTGTAEFNNVWVRGELHSSIFVMDEFHASGGTLFVATAAALENDAVLSSARDEALTNCRTTAFSDQNYVDCRTTSASGSGSQITARVIENWIEISDPASGHAQVFAAGDVVRCKTFNGTSVFDLWMRINAITDLTAYYRYHVQVMSGTYATLPAGSAVVSYGKNGDGRILLTSDQNYAPYIDIFTVGSNPWAGGLTPHVRLGRLDGVGVPGLSGVKQYGLVAGTNLSNANSPYIAMTNLMAKLYKIDLTLNDGTNDTVSLAATGRVKFGKNIGQSAQTGLDFDPATGNITIGGPSYPGAVTVYGTVTVQGGDVPWTVISGSGKPVDNATKNVIYRQASQPSGANGDLWYDTTNKLLYRHNGSAWEQVGNGYDNLDLIADGSTYGRINKTIIGGGYIRVGSGTKDVNLNGWFIDNSEIVGQSNGVDQVVLGTDGKVVAGAGYVVIDASGELITRTSWYTTESLEPGYQDPDTTPSAAQTMRFRDTGFTWYNSYPNNPPSYTYNGNTLLRLYASSKHYIQANVDPGFWDHYLDGVVEVPTPTVPAQSGPWHSRLWLRGQYIILDGDVMIFNGVGNNQRHIVGVRTTA